MKQHIKYSQIFEILTFPDGSRHFCFDDSLGITRSYDDTVPYKCLSFTRNNIDNRIECYVLMSTWDKISREDYNTIKHSYLKNKRFNKSLRKLL